MDQPIVSIIICVYNGEKYIERCLNSVLTQTFKTIEVLVINDGSTDHTVEICEKFADSRLRVINKEQNAGLSAARNTGLATAKGEYVTFVDSDDYVEADFIERLFEAVKKTGADMSVCAYYREKASGKKSIISNGSSRIVGKEKALCAVFEDNSWGGYTWNKLFRMSIVQKIQWNFIPELKKGEDMVALCQYLTECKRIAYINKPLYHYMYNEASICRSVKNLKSVDQRDLSNLEAHRLMEKLIKTESDQVQRAFQCRLLCTHMRLLVNMTYCQDRDQAVMKQSQQTIRKYLKIFLHSPLRSKQEKGGAILLAIHPGLFWLAYGMANRIFGITIS